LKFRVDAFEESGGVGVGPVGMLRFEVGANLFPGVIGRYALALEREPRVRISEIRFSSAATSEPSPGALWSGKTCAALRAATLSSTASQLAGVPPSPKMFGMVLYYVARISFSYYVLTCTVGIAPACHVAALLGYTGIHSHEVTCNSMGVPKRLPKPGQHLRARRLSLGLTLRDVHMASLSLARELRKPAFVLPPSRLHEIETKKMTPSVHRLYTLAYRCRLNELLSWFGIPPR
jgi:hypothetical protein